MTEHLCVICQRRQFERPNVCVGDRLRLGYELSELRDLYADLSDSTVGYWPDERARDPLAFILPAGPVPGASGAPRVSGTAEPSSPLNLDVWAMLTGPLQWDRTTRGYVRRPETVHDERGDQVGPVGVAWVLDAWCGDWADYRGKGERRPTERVHFQVAWLANRLDWACDEHPAVDDFAAELRGILRTLRRLTGQQEPRPQLCEGVPCRRCDLKTLYRLPGDTYIECDPQRRYGGCGLLLTEAEFRQWVGLLAAAVRRGEVA